MRFFAGLPLPSAGRAEDVVAVVADKLRAFRDVLVFLYDIKTEKRFEAMRKNPIKPVVLSACLQLGLFSCGDQRVGTAREAGKQKRLRWPHSVIPL